VKFKGKLWGRITRKSGIIEAIPLFNNGITIPGINDILNVYFNGGTQKTSWYALLISDTSYSALSDNDTMGSHGGWTEQTNYNLGTRPEIPFDNAAATIITHATEFSYTFSADNSVVKGIGVTSNSTKGGTTGTLWSTALFSDGDRTFDEDDVLDLFYSLGGSE
jgi:hypothetical protein